MRNYLLIIRDGIGLAIFLILLTWAMRGLHALLWSGL